ncbi:Mrp/NBP35 family ATP-binding protein [Paracoccus sp. p4-l81]|uniref:Mrp/NBP35 family ATP-binding protein n=1 Tax=unclassified Paracoccus (in: a-proteobacteria) TaxID=2688777 RepID=UPI0035BA00F4
MTDSTSPPDALRDRVAQALSDLSLPGLAGSAADHARGLVIGADGAVRMVLDPQGAGGTADEAALRDLAQAVRQALSGLAGVTSVSAAVASAPVIAPQPTAPDGPTGIPGVRHVIAVGSGKGGVGKSTVSANLALALADQGLRVGLLDADIYGPSLPRMLGADDARPIAREDMMIPISAQGIKVMSVGFLFEQSRALVWRGPILVTALRQMLFEVDWAPLDVLVVDLPPGTGDVQITLAQQIPLTGAVIVTTPQDVALLDARRAIDLFDQVDTPVLGLIENMSMHVCPNCGFHDPVFGQGGGEAEAEARGIPFLGALPLDRTLRETGDGGQPIVRAQPDSAPATAFRDLAEVLAEAFRDDT